MMSESIEIEVVYASEQKQSLLPLRVPVGTTAREAVLQSKLPALFPDVDFQVAPIGIFGKKTPDQTILMEFDRVEVYRQLKMDPKAARRLRVAKKSNRDKK